MTDPRPFRDQPKSSKEVDVEDALHLLRRVDVPYGLNERVEARLNAARLIQTNRSSLSMVSHADCRLGAGGRVDLRGVGDSLFPLGAGCGDTGRRKACACGGSAGCRGDPSSGKAGGSADNRGEPHRQGPIELTGEA